VTKNELYAIFHGHYEKYGLTRIFSSRSSQGGVSEYLLEIQPFTQPQQMADEKCGLKFIASNPDIEEGHPIFSATL